MKKYRIREGSIADYGRVALASMAFWALIGYAVLTSYPM